jgi:DNA-binding response OmpR family regulator
MTSKVLLTFLVEPVRADYLAAFSENGYQIELALNGNMAQSLVLTSSFDAAILIGQLSDLVFSLLVELAKRPQPVICVMPAAESDEVALLNAGATIWLPNDTCGDVVQKWIGKLLDLVTLRWPAGFQFDTHARLAIFQGSTVNLRPIEFDILLHLARHAGRPVAGSELQQRFWPEQMTSDPRLAVHMHNVRSALAVVGADAMLKRVPGAGYCLLDSRPPAVRRCLRLTRRSLLY